MVIPAGLGIHCAPEGEWPFAVVSGLRLHVVACTTQGCVLKRGWLG